MVQIFTSVKNTFVHAHVDNPDCVGMSSGSRRRSSSTPALVSFDAAENEMYNAHASEAHGLEVFPLLPHDDGDYASIRVHPGPSPLDIDVEGMFGDFDDHFLGLVEWQLSDEATPDLVDVGREIDDTLSEESEDYNFFGLVKWQPSDEATPDFVDVGREIDDTLSEESEDYNAFAADCHDLTYGAMLPNPNYGESLKQNQCCLLTASMTPHEQQQDQLFSTSPMSRREDHGDSYRQSNSGAELARAQRSAKHGETQGEEKRTTVMLMNVPRGYTNSKLMRTIDSEGFAIMYDFIYVPMVAARTSKGYAFVNFVNPSIAQRFLSAFNGFSKWSTKSKNVCQAVWATKHQGLHANIDHFRNSTVLSESVPDEYKPRILEKGEEMPFPPPNRKPSMPTRRARQRRKTNASQALSL